MESLISDLALILFVGAIVTWIFKKLGQPLVLGYIVAGFLASPHFSYMPTVANEENIEFWAQIGIVVLLFSLGLEFSFNKLKNVGGSAMTTALIIVMGMMGLGFVAGHLLGFKNIDCLFLGGMLSMSSTTIIIKAFDDLNMRHRRFAPLVLAVLICEDLFAVVMMVLLSSVAINNSVDSNEILMSVAKLAFFLIILFTVGVFLLPTFLHKNRRFLTNEMLLVFSMGICFVTAMAAYYSGFSLALGAFASGSIIAGTTLAERVEHVVEPVKNLFGAVFFISVGMMVNPQLILEHAGTITLLAIVVIVGMITFGTLGMLVTGQPLKIAMESGFSLTQIGEFAFIIASLGMSLNVLDGSIYPIVVAVSVITTFFTPYFIKASVPCYEWVEKRLPPRLQFLLTNYSKTESEVSERNRLWRNVVGHYAWRIVLYSAILIAIEIMVYAYLYPWLTEHLGATWGRHVTAAFTLTAMSPFLLALALPGTKASVRRRLSEIDGRLSQVPLIVMRCFRLMVACGFVVSVFTGLYSFGTVMAVVLASVIIIVISLSRHMRKRMHSMESRFVRNLNQRENERSGKGNILVSDLHMAQIKVGYDCPFVGEKLINSDIRKRYGVNIVSIQRGSVNIPIPGGETRIFPNDVLGIIGTDEQIQELLPILESAKTSHDAPAPAVKLMSFKLNEGSPLIGKTTATARLRDDYTALLVAIQRGKEYIKPDGKEPFFVNDILWVVGNPEILAPLKGNQ